MTPALGLTVYHAVAPQTYEENEENTSRYLIASKMAVKQGDLAYELNTKKLRTNSPEGLAVAVGDAGTPAPTPSLTALTASEMWCATCQVSQPIALDGRVYRCTVCLGIAAGVRTHFPKWPLI